MRQKTPLEEIALEKFIELSWLFLVFFIPNAVWYVYFHAQPAVKNLPEFFFTNCFNSLPYVTIFFLAFRSLPRFVALSLLAAVLLVLSLASWIGVSHYLIFSHPINDTSIYVALNSNLLEAREFISTYKTFPIFAGLAAILTVEGFVFWLISKRCFPGSKKKVATVIVALVFLQPSWSIATSRSNVFADDNLVFVYSEAIGQYRSDLREIRKNKAEVKTAQAVYQVRTLPQQAAKKETYILVMGESTSRRHMGIYGYRRGTTPFLASLSKEVFRFDDVISPHSHTIPVLQKALTVRNSSIRDDVYRNYKLLGKEIHRCPNLLGLMRKAGFRTFWLSNQMVLGQWDLWNTFFSETADRRVFTNTETKESSYDEALLPHLKRALADPAPKKVIVLHLMGAHTNAADRFPESFAKFSSRDIPVGEGTGYPSRSIHIRNYINRYDDAVRYGDLFLYKVLEQLKAEDGQKMLVFFSDHGEEVGEINEFIGHTEIRGSRYMFEIPFLVWCSPEYMAARPDLAGQLPKAVSRPYQTDDFMHTFMDMTGAWADGFNPEKSIVNPRFVPRKRIVRGIDYEKVRNEVQ